MHLTNVLALLAFASRPVAAQVVADDRPTIPSAGIAAESGPGSLWVNPANQVYDPDARYGLWVGHDLGGDPTSFAAMAGTGGVSVGVHNVSVPRDLAGGRSDWSLDYTSAVRLPERIAVGFRAAWRLKDGGNFVSYDVGAAWRPLPWFGVGAVAYNVTSSRPSALARSGAGIAVRPFGKFLTLSWDFVHTFDPDAPSNAVSSSIRLRPMRGLFLRGNVDTDLEGGLTFGGGLELFFGDWGAGGYAVTDGDDVGVITFLGTEDPGEALIRTGDRVPVLVLDHRPGYEKQTGFLASGDTTWLETLELLRRSEDDKAVRGVAIVLQGAGLSWAQAEELRARIQALQANGKGVVAYLYGSGGSTDYYVATAASHVVLHPSEDLSFVGVGAEQEFFRGAFDLVGVEPQFVRRREYKSAVEQYTNTEPSPAAVEAMDALLDDLQAALVAGVAQGRNLEPAAVQALIDGGPYTAREAYDKGLVDEIAYPDEIEDSIENYLGHATINLTDLADMPQPHSGWKASAEIAVVYIDGAIVTGRSGGGGLFGGGANAGSVTIVNALDQAREDDQVKAVVLRVDSPGGSSFASDDIHRAVERLQEEGKPVVVSMGGLAASGGYYVACGSDAIWAEPTTITGSIGVYSGKFATGRLMERVGVHVESYERGRNAGINSSVDPWDALQRERMDAMVGATYDEFKKKVGNGRNLTPEQVEEVARGRVWTGSRGQERGLVDNIGGLQDAIDDARQRAGIPEGRPVAIVSYSQSGTMLETLAPTQMKVNEAIVKALLPGLAERLQTRVELPPFARSLANAFAPALMMADHPDEVWAYDPSLQGLDGHSERP